MSAVAVPPPRAPRARRLLMPVRWVACEAIKPWECCDADPGKDCITESRDDDMPDCTAGKDYDVVEAAVDRLLRDLKAAERHPEGSRPVG